MAITVYVFLKDGEVRPVEVPKGKKVDFSHPGAPLSVYDAEGKLLLVVHPHQWVYAESTKE